MYAFRYAVQSRPYPVCFRPATASVSLLSHIKHTIASGVFTALLPFCVWMTIKYSKPSSPLPQAPLVLFINHSKIFHARFPLAYSPSSWLRVFCSCPSCGTSPTRVLLLQVLQQRFLSPKVSSSSLPMALGALENCNPASSANSP